MKVYINSDNTVNYIGDDNPNHENLTVITLPDNQAHMSDYSNLEYVNDVLREVSTE